MRIVLLASLFAVVSCATPTSFSGAPKVPKGAAGCRTICSSYEMELVGMIALGEYSDGCICGVPGKTPSTASAASAGAAAAAMTALPEQERQAQDVTTGIQLTPPSQPPPSP